MGEPARFNVTSAVQAITSAFRGVPTACVLAGESRAPQCPVVTNMPAIVVKLAITVTQEGADGSREPER